MVSNRRKAKMTSRQLAQLAADWRRAKMMEILARSSAQQQATQARGSE